MKLYNKRFNVPFTSPEAVIFDTDNTLYPYVPAHEQASIAVEDKVQKTLGINKAEFREAYSLARVEIKERLGNVASSHSRLLYLQTTIEKLGLGTRILLTLDLEQTYWRTFLVNCRLFPDALNFIHVLKAKGIATANITDLTAQIQFRKLVYFGLDELFDFVVTSEEAGRDKPDSKPFEVALEKLNMEAKNIWMIGDNPLNDMVGAHHCGMVKVQKVHSGVVVGKTIESRPDIAFHHYGQLIKLFSD